MLRDDLIALLSQFDNDIAAVDIHGLLVDIVDVHHDARRESVVLTLDPEDMRMLVPEAGVERMWAGGPRGGSRSA